MDKALTLHDLSNGQIFIHAADKKVNPSRFTVYGNARYNNGHGGATRNCLDSTGTIVSKSCRLEVIKKGVSIHIDKIKALFDQPKK